MLAPTYIVEPVGASNGDCPFNALCCSRYAFKIFGDRLCLIGELDHRGCELRRYAAKDFFGAAHERMLVRYPRIEFHVRREPKQEIGRDGIDARRLPQELMILRRRARAGLDQAQLRAIRVAEFFGRLDGCHAREHARRNEVVAQRFQFFGQGLVAHESRERLLDVNLALRVGHRRTGLALRRSIVRDLLLFQIDCSLVHVAPVVKTFSNRPQMAASRSHVASSRSAARQVIASVAPALAAHWYRDDRR